MPDFETASLATLKDFATKLIGISPGIWSDTYVFTGQERKDVMAAIQEVQAAMKDLNDSDPRNDAAAEKKLRDGLKKAKPMLEKLSGNIGKGVLVKLGLIRDRLVTDALADVKKQLEEDLKKLVLRLDEEQRATLAMHGPHRFGYKDREGDKTKLEAKIRLIERLMSDQQARQLFEERIERNTTDDSYLNEQENVLKPLFDKEENKSKSSKDLLNAGKWTKVISIMNKYLDDQVDAEQLLAGSSSLVTDVDNQSAFTVPKDKVYYLTPDGKPLNLDNFNGVVLIEPYGKGLQYVVTGVSMAVNNKKISWFARGKDDKFIGYVNTNDAADIFKLDGYVDLKPSTCKAKLPYAIDQCYYKMIIGENWQVPNGKTVSEVQQQLAKFVVPFKTIDKSAAISFVTLNVNGVTIPGCTNPTGNGSGGAQPEVTVMVRSVKDVPLLVAKLSAIGLKLGNGGGYYFDRIIVSDDMLTTEELNALNTTVDNDVKNRSNFRCLWISLDKEGKFKSVKTVYSKDVPKEVTAILDAYRDYVKYLGERKEWQKFLDGISDALKQLADFIRKARIPEKYYNPLDKEYDADSFVLFLFKQAAVASAYTGGLGPVIQMAPGIYGKTTDKIGIPEVDFAFYCGIWNGLVDQIASLPEAASWLIDLITDKDHARTEFIAGMQKMHKEAEKAGGFCNMIGQLINKNFNSPNAALNAHSYGMATSQIITIFLSIAKVGQASKVVNVLNKLDVVGVLADLAMTPFIKILGGATKVIVTKSGKFALVLVKETGDVVSAFFKGSKRLEGKMYSFAVPFVSNVVGAGEEVIKKFKKIKKWLKDSEGNIMKDEQGRNLALVEDEEGNVMHAAVTEIQYDNLDNWLTNLANKADIEAIIKDWDEDLLLKLNNDLGHEKYGNELKQVFSENAAELDIWKELKLNPEDAWDIMERGNVGKNGGNVSSSNTLPKPEKHLKKL